MKSILCFAVLHQDRPVWLDGALPANTCIPTSFPKNMTLQLQGIPTLKIHFQVYKIKHGEAIRLQVQKIAKE
jgi:hypothetical protein